VLISLTAEMRQFELIVVDVEPLADQVSARIFTAQEELPFAGHPVILGRRLVTLMPLASRERLTGLARVGAGANCG